MPDWNKLVREKLAPLPLESTRAEEVVEELSGQLQCAYEEALLRGVSEEKALNESLAQFRDWEKLRANLFRAIEGTPLPVWQKRSIFAPGHPFLWLTIALALAFLALPAFRQALHFLPVPGDLDVWNAKLLSQETLDRFERSGDRPRYARALAYVALHNPDDQQAQRAAEKAIEMDPGLTWICAYISHAYYLMPGHDPKPWIERLERWDPNNGFPYILEAGADYYAARETRWTNLNAATGELRRALYADRNWRRAMEKAFAAPRVDSYGAQRFALEKQFLQEKGLDRPDLLMTGLSTQVLPDFVMIKLYADSQTEEVGGAAQKAGRTDEAIAAYETVTEFGKRPQGNSTDIEKTFPWRLRASAYEKLIPLLRKNGRESEASAVDAELAAMPRNDDFHARRVPGAVDDGRGWRSARVMLISACILIVSGFLALLWLLAVCFLRWKPAASRPLNRLATVLCYAPPALPLACLGVLLEYQPFAGSIARFSSAGELFHTYEPLVANLYAVRFDPVIDIWFLRLFWPAIWCALILLAGAFVLRWNRHKELGEQ